MGEKNETECLPGYILEELNQKVENIQQRLADLEKKFQACLLEYDRICLELRGLPVIGRYIDEYAGPIIERKKSLTDEKGVW